MKPSVDVLIARRSAGTLKPSLRSIVNGAEGAITVRTCVLRKPLQRRIEMSLTVDPATAEQFSRACRSQNIWERGVIPAGIAMAVVIGIFGDEMGSRMSALTSLAVVVLIIVALAGRQQLVAKASPHHPRLQHGDAVLVRGVDRQVAHSWLSINSPGAITIAD